MSTPINAEGSVPTGQVAPEVPSSSREPLKDAQGADPEFVALLADTQNACLDELGYSATLLADFQETKKGLAALQRQHVELQNLCNLLRADNTKLYADNRSLATYIQQQDQRMKLLQDPNDQQKRAVTDLHDSVRRLTIERDELSGRLHSALNEIVVLRQELARFVPNAIMISPRERMPSGGVAIPQPPQRVPSQTPIHPSTLPAHAPVNMMHYQNVATKHIQPGVRPPLPPLLSQHRGSVPTNATVNTTAHLPLVSQHRRPSAPAQLVTGQLGFTQSPISASPINSFSGLTLAGSNPPTPVTSRPPTAAGQLPIFPQSAPPSRPPSSREGAPMHPPVPHRSSSSSLAGAVIDLTGDDYSEDGVRKKRKLDHHASLVAAPSAWPSEPINAPPPMASGFPHGTGGYIPPVQAGISRPETMSANGSQPVTVGAALAAPRVAAAAEQMPAVPQPAQSQPPAAALPVPAQDVTMEDAQQEPQTTIEEDCLDINFDEDEEDETKKWCCMCRSRFDGGHTKEAPTPFINAPEAVLIEHCEQVHPRGWEILKNKMVEARSAEDAEL